MADARPPLEAVPADALAVWLNSGPDTHEPSESATSSILAFTRFAADQAARTGLLHDLDPDRRAWLDVLIGCGEMSAYGHVLMLLDYSALARDDGGHQLETLSSALVIRTGGDNRKIEQRIRRLLLTYTNTRETSVTTSRREGETLHTLRDRRLRPGMEITWGAVGGDYVIALGNGVFGRIKACLKGGGPSLADDPWFRQQVRSASNARTPITLYLNVDRIMAPADAALVEKISRVQQSLGLHGVHRLLLTGGWPGRALQLRAELKREHRTDSVVLAGDISQTPALQSAVPDEAAGYAAIHLQPAAMIRGIATAYLASRSSGVRDRSRTFWRDMLAGAELSIQEDILSKLTGPIIVHDYPPLVFNLPLAITIQIPIKSGETEALCDALDRLLRSGQHRLNDKGAARLMRDEDGLWRMRFGWVEPALTVADRWLILSTSPYAARFNARRLKARDESGSGRRATPEDPP